MFDKHKSMKQLQVMGPFNSGTNLLIRILMENCEDITSGSLVNISENMCFWKHTLRRDFIDAHIHDPDKIFIILFKHLYNWIPSIEKNPYDIIFLDHDIMGSIQMQNFRYDNIVQLYNRYYRLYRDLLEKHRRMSYASGTMI